MFCSILRILKSLITGVDDDEVPPVPIPNTEVKLISVENTWLVTAWEDRMMPVRKRNPFKGFFSRYCLLAQSVEHAAVNRRVVSSSLTEAATRKDHVNTTWSFLYLHMYSETYKNESGLLFRSRFAVVYCFFS